MVIICFFIAHWQLSVFFQSFFLHRYGAHKQFEMSRGWERFFHLSTYLVQGPSFLSARAYAILHRMHHAFSDTAKDPHSPENYKNVPAPSPSATARRPSCCRSPASPSGRWPRRRCWPRSPTKPPRAARSCG